MVNWDRLASCVDDVTTLVRIAIVGKYTGLQDSYLSVIKVRLDRLPSVHRACALLYECMVRSWKLQKIVQGVDPRGTQSLGYENGQGAKETRNRTFLEESRTLFSFLENLSVIMVRV